MTATSVEKVNGTTLTAEPRFEYDPVALAKAEAIRTEAAAKAEAACIEAAAKAEVEKVKAAEEARKQKLANDKAEQRAEEEQAARAARIAKLNRERVEQERAAREAEEKAAAQEQAEEARAAELAAAEDQWRKYALRFYAVCSIVALPVQIAAFYNPNALWLMAAPIMLEGGAWVVLKGARAAATGHRPHWHYRLIAWCLAFIAAGINLWHGLHAFDPATAIGTAFASIAGPGVYDLHEHGQIRKRDGVPSRRERKAAEKAAKAEAKERAAEEERKRAAKAAADEAAEQARQELRDTRQKVFEDVWTEAVKIGAALGKAPDDPAVWSRAYRNIKGCDPGESIESITARRTAEKRVQSALTGTPVNTVGKTTNAQRAAQMPPGPNRVLKTRATRRPGDTPKYVGAARKQAAITAKTAAEKQDGDVS
ncbi:hypothetical protein [Streptomyces europaeiscabiei]|uniref:hypothetical protein n=1 Tax=Streptomyces europaeiscabiei TaxID=146819 RepID=UPI0029B2E81D|nr:hypothetical protein [Streptomyces europaeiscabiei]MDX3839581.1 hypothetical protein [Streptomyces europaeiscabiei]